MSGQQADQVLAGLGDPVFDSNAIFRAVLSATASPGKIVDFPVDVAAPAGLNAPACGIALTLCDMDTPVWLGPGCNGEAARRHLAFHTGAPVVQRPEQADYALVRSTGEWAFLDRLRWGDDAYPDRSATLIVMVESLSDTGGAVLRGPGILESRTFAAEPLGEPFWAWRVRNRQLFPLGVDVIFASDGAVAALPRSTEVER